jgi:ribosomal protein S27E
MIDEDGFEDQRHLQNHQTMLKRAKCPSCGEPWLRPSQLPGRFRCVYCLHRFELVSQCPNCGEHQTIVRMSTTEDMTCQTCGDSMLRPI